MTQKSFLIAFLATIVRYYDYALFGLAAAKLSGTFFATSAAEDRLLHFFVVFGAAVYMRPLGSLLFGYIGDSYGRIVSIKSASIIASVTTICIGLLPDTNVIGVLSAILLLIFRMLFLVSIAGEVDAIKIYISEKSNPIRRNRACGVVIFCSQIGALIASVSFYITVRFGGEYWRLSFLFGGVLGLVVVAFRHYFQEAELFVKYKQNSQSAPNIAKTWDIIKNYRLLFVTAILISGVIGGMYNFLVIFFPPFLQQAFGEPSLSPQVLSTSLIILYAVTAIISGILADFLREKQILLAITVSICSGLFFYPEIKQPAILIFLLGALSPLYSVPLQILMQFSFPINIRMRMVSLAHSIGSMIFSANTPLLGMLIWKKTGSLELVVIVPFLYLVILLVSTWMLLKIQVKDN